MPLALAQRTPPTTRILRTHGLARAFRLAPALCALLLAAAPAGPALAAWDEIGGDDVVLAKLDIAENTTPVIEVAENGDIYVAVSIVLTDRTGVYIYRSQDGGDHWAIWGTLDSTGVNYTDPCLHIAEGTQDWLYVACAYKGPSELRTQIWVARSPLATASWTVVPALSTAADDFAQPALASDATNYGSYYLYLAAEAADGNGKDIWFTRSTNYGSSWAAGYEIASLATGSDYRHPSLCYGMSGVLHCTYAFYPVYGSGLDKAIRYRRATDFADAGVGDWQPVVYLSSNTDGFDEYLASVAASHGSANVVASWDVYDPVLHTLGSNVKSSGDLGATWSAPQWMEDQYTSQILALPGTGGFSIRGEFTGGRYGLRSAPDASPLAWSAHQTIADRNSDVFWGLAPSQLHQDYDPSRGNRRAVVWAGQNLGGAVDTVFFDAEWRRDPGYANLEAGFPMSLSAAVVAPPAICELDGDAESEIVFGDASGRIVALNHDGTAVPGWPVDIGTFQADATIAVGDITGDGYNDVVAGNDAGYVYAFDRTGAELPGWARDTGTGLPAYVAIGGISTETRQVAVCSGSKVILYNGTGSTAPGYPKSMAGAISAAPAIGDVDGDGDREIVILQEHYMDVLRGDGSVQAYRNVAGDAQTFSNAPTLADLNLDGDLEIMAPTDQGRLYVMNPDGSDYPGGWPYVDPAGVRLTSVALAQMRSDMAPELVFNVEGAATPKVHAFFHTKIECGGFPLATDPGWFLYGMPIVDALDGETPDVVVGTRDMDAYAWDNYGNPLPGWPEPLAARCNVSPASGDIDADGRVEVLFATNSPATFAAYDLGSAVYRDPTYPTRWWPMYGYNAMRQGCLACDQDRVTAVPGGVSAPRALLFAAPVPNPASGPMSLSFQLPEAAAVRLDLFDAQGRLVEHVLREEMGAGTHQLSLDPRTRASGVLPAGVYYLRLAVSGPTVSRELTRKVVVLR